MQIKFIGATETVTGSKHLIRTETDFTLLLDCGLYQGLGKQTETLNRNLDLNPKEVDVVVLSHAHIDHSGNLPLLVKSGFNGKIYCTPPTLKVVEVLLMDSAKIHVGDVAHVNKFRLKNNLELLEPIYNENDVEKCLKHFKTVPYNAKFKLNDEVELTFTDAGHILGSAVINLKITEKTQTQYLTFTGDVGRYSDMLLKDPSPFPQADYIICESTYGNKLHESDEDAESKFLDIVIDTCQRKKGKLIIPAFSLGRTQEIVFMLDKLKNKNLLPNFKVFVDSPLSTSITNIMRDHVYCFNDKLQEYIKTDKDPFGFNNLTYIRDKEDSIALNDLNEPCIILSASGMMDAGRIKFHLQNTLDNAKNTLLIVGYCSPNSLGRQLRDGKKAVKIFGQEIEVKADVKIIDSYSAHADYNELLKFLSCQDKNLIQKIFLVHGENESKIGFKEILNKKGYKEVILPNKYEVFNL